MKRFCSFVLIGLMLMTGRATGAEPAKVYMALWNGCEEACHGFLDYLKSARANVSIIQHDLKQKTGDIAAVTAEIKEISPDLLVTWGTLASLEILGRESNALKYGTMPALFMVVSQPVESGLVSSTVSQGRNITGVTQMPSLPEQLRFARRMLPFKRLGVVYNPAESNARVAVEQLKRYALMFSFELVERPVPMNEGGKPDAFSVAGLVAELADAKVDLIYLGPDAFMNAHRKALIETATAFSIPVFSASEGAVRNDGALFALVHRYYTVGQLAGQKAMKILKDKTQAYDIPVESPQRPLPVVNMTAARDTGVYPPMAVMQEADLVNIPEK